jgi:hypothetical protein
VFGNKRLLALSGAVEVTNRNRSVFRRFGGIQVVREAVLLDEALRDDPEDLGPDFTDGMDTPVTRLVESLVRRRVDSLVLETHRLKEKRDGLGEHTNE